MAYIGLRLGANWAAIGPYFHRFNLVWGPLLVIVAGFFLWHHVRRFRQQLPETGVDISKGSE